MRSLIGRHLRIQKCCDLEFVSVQNGRVVNYFAGAAGGQHRNLVAKIDNAGIAQQLRNRVQVPVIGQAFENEIALLREQALGQIVPERFLQRQKRDRIFSGNVGVNFGPDTAIDHFDDANAVELIWSDQKGRVGGVKGLVGFGQARDGGAEFALFEGVQAQARFVEQKDGVLEVVRALGKKDDEE